MKDKYNIVKVVNAVMHWDELSVEDYKMFYWYYLHAFCHEDRWYHFIWDVVNSLLLNIKLYCSLDKWDSMSDAQRFVYIRKTWKSVYFNLLNQDKMQYWFGTVGDVEPTDPRDWMVQIKKTIWYWKIIEEIDELVSHLSAREQEIYDMRLCQWLGYSRISKELNISKERCRQCVKRLRDKIITYFYTEWFIY